MKSLGCEETELGKWAYYLTCWENIEFCSAGGSERPIVPSTSYQHILVLMELYKHPLSLNMVLQHESIMD